MRPALAWMSACAGVASCSLALAQPVPDPTRDRAGEQARELRVAGGALPVDQRLIPALKGDRLRWRITSDAAGELHLHAYRLSAAVQPGSVTELIFTAHATGRFRVEWHARGETGAASHGHGSAPLATLEVRPR